MANNKVQLADGSVLIDLTDTTALATDVETGKVFYLANGQRAEGTGMGSIIDGNFEYYPIGDGNYYIKLKDGTSGNEWTSGIYQDTDGYIRVSPLGAAGGVVMDADGFLVLSETQSGADSYATITVSSSAPSGGNDGDVWVQPSAVYKRESGVWEQQADLSDIFDPNVIYLRSE